MSVPPPSQPSSRNPRKRSHTVACEPSHTYAYEDLTLSGSRPSVVSALPVSFHQPGQDYHQHFNLHSASAAYLTADHYPEAATSSKPTGSPDPSSQLYAESLQYYSRTAHAVPNMMMSQREMGYGYMPAPPMQNPLQYSSGPPYPGSLAPLPGYYSEPPQHQRSYSGSSRPSSLPVIDFQPLGSEENDASFSSRKRRRTSQLDIRRQNKMRVRRNQLPSILDLGGKGNDLSSAPVDIYPAVSAASTYVNDRPSMSPPYRNEYNDPQPGHHSYVSPPYQQANYSMGHMNAGNLAPPLLANGSQGYSPGPGRSSPLLQAPLPPAPSVSQHVEPVVVGGGREKPQCWDHGCNGREFSTFSNLLRHQREKSGSAAKSYCPHCGAEFTRTTARNGHMEHGKCKTRKTSDTSVTKR